MKLFLVGFMGAGKTTVGRELAARLSLPFFDLDEMIEQSVGMTVRAIFSEHGEAWFRTREREMLRSFRHLSRGVIATGGGTFTFDDNMQFIQGDGISIYLSVPYALIRQRVALKRDDRPLFQDDLAALELYQQRLRYYRKSDIVIEIREGEEVKEVVERLILELPADVRALARPLI